jgi:hypothetical protein
MIQANYGDITVNEKMNIIKKKLIDNDMKRISENKARAEAEAEKTKLERFDQDGIRQDVNIESELIVSFQNKLNESTQDLHNIEKLLILAYGLFGHYAKGGKGKKNEEGGVTILTFFDNSGYPTFKKYIIQTNTIYNRVLYKTLPNLVEKLKSINNVSSMKQSFESLFKQDDNLESIAEMYIKQFEPDDDVNDPETIFQSQNSATSKKEVTRYVDRHIHELLDDIEKSHNYINAIKKIYKQKQIRGGSFNKPYDNIPSKYK